MFSPYSNGSHQAGMRTAPTPTRVLASYLSGYGSIEANGGEVRPLEPRTILLAKDTTGRGPITRATSTEEMVVAKVTLSN